MGGKLIAFLVGLFVCVSALAQTDTSAIVPDTMQQETYLLNPDSFNKVVSAANYTSPFFTTEGKTVVSDVQQYLTPKSNAYVFVVLVVLLLILTYVKTAFSNDLEDMLQSFINRNMAQQVFRLQPNELTFSSLLLHVNFILVVSLYLRFFLVRYYHVSTLESFSSILFLIFLFTFFYLTKLIALKLIGYVFELNEVCDEYIFNFTTVCKTLGLTLIPALFIFYTAPEKFFNFVFISSLILVAAFAVSFIWRGLSTAYKLLYRSVYHFFIYVCVVEVSLIFLLFKLLTKTVV